MDVSLVRALPTSAPTSGNVTQRFAVGQTLTGTVLRVSPEAGALVNFHGQHVLINLPQPVVRGQALTATVAQVSPHLLLNIVDGHTQDGHVPSVSSSHQGLPEPAHTATDQAPASVLSAPLLKSYLAAKQPFGQMAATLEHVLLHHPLRQEIDPTLLQRLQDTLAVLLPRDASPPNASGLREQVERSGINYETQVKHVLLNNLLTTEKAQLTHDFKGQLLELAQQLEHVVATGSEATAKEAGEILQQVKQGLQNIELQQLTNVVAHEEHQPLLLQLTHPLFATAKTAQLYIRNNAKQRRDTQTGQQDYTLVLLLDFTALGPLRVDATVRHAEVSATIKVEETAVADFITAQLADLASGLHEVGFQAHITCCVEDNVPLDVDDSLTRLLLSHPFSLVDIRA